jgi:hypothetical protein
VTTARESMGAVRRATRDRPPHSRVSGKGHHPERGSQQSTTLFGISCPPDARRLAWREKPLRFWLRPAELERLTGLVVLLSFGQCNVESLDAEESLFNRVAADLGLAIRDWWPADEEFLALVRKDQLEAVAIESRASLRMGKLKGYSKKDLVGGLARHFERTADLAATLDEHDQRDRNWIPGAMSFPARAAVTMVYPG